MIMVIRILVLAAALVIAVAMTAYGAARSRGRLLRNLILALGFVFFLNTGFSLILNQGSWLGFVCLFGAAASLAAAFCSFKKPVGN
jgi:hypothetical protein